MKCCFCRNTDQPCFFSELKVIKIMFQHLLHVRAMLRCFLAFFPHSRTKEYECLQLCSLFSHTYPSGLILIIRECFDRPPWFVPICPFFCAAFPGYYLVVDPQGGGQMIAFIGGSEKPSAAVSYFFLTESSQRLTCHIFERVSVRKLPIKRYLALNL